MGGLFFLPKRFGNQLCERAFLHKGKRERFKELCELAEVQEDTTKLGKIANEINSILDAELIRLKKIEEAYLNTTS
jgi:hypothetical protein